MLQTIRQLKKESRGAKQAGFTIIEVMIVLAIAGLIMGIVFLAIPALQRNNRNTQRKSDVGKLAQLINDFVTNNNGSLPTAIVVGTVASPVSTTLYTGTDKFSIITVPTTIVAFPTTLPGAPDADTAIIYTKSSCNGGNTPGSTTSARSFAIWYGIEGSTKAQCLEG